MITFLVNKNADLTIYGFVEEKTNWSYWKGTRKLWVNKSDYSLHFNLPTLTDLKVFYDMVKDNVVVVKDIPRNKCRYYYMNVSKEEYDMIIEKRNKEMFDN